MKKLAAFGILGVIGATATANADWEFRARIVVEVGFNTFAPLEGNVLNVFDGNARVIGIQFGVFDDVTDPLGPEPLAPAGGFIGWNDGTITVTTDTSGA